MEETRVNKDYIEAFNQGYQLSKDLNLKPEILKGLSSGNHRMQAMKEGMEQYQTDILDKSKIHNREVIPPIDIDEIDNNYTEINVDIKERDKGIDMDY